MTACSQPGCRDGWVWVDIDDDEHIKQRCPACERTAAESCINPNNCCGYCPPAENAPHD